MRLAAILARVAAQDINTTSTAEMFHAATVGGATALGRDDIGRLAPGARADLVLVDLTQPVHAAGARSVALADLYRRRSCRAGRLVDGDKVVQDRPRADPDHGGALAALAEAQARMEADVPNHDWARPSRRRDRAAESAGA